MEKKKQFSDSHSPARRSLISHGGAVIGAWLLASPATAKNPGQDTSPASGIYDVKKYGATGKRQDNATRYFRNAIEACAAAGGGIVHVPPGDYTVGTVRLLDHVTLNIEGGATLFLSQDRNDFLPGGRAMIFAENARNIAVTGRGTLNGLAQYDYTEMRGIGP